MNHFSFDHVSFRTEDVKGASKFWVDIFNAKVKDEFIIDDREFCILELDGGLIEIAQPARSSDLSPSNSSEAYGFWHVALRVENIEQCLSELRRKGIQIIKGPREVLDLKIAFIEGFENTLIELIERPNG